MAVLDIIMGPMFAGKSCELIRRIRLLKILKKKYLVIKPRIDNRYEEHMIVSHNFDKEECIVLSDLEDIFNYELNDIKSIFIDEAQFFNNLKISVLKLVDELNINVVITGLDGDSNRNKFGEILDLIPYCNSCVKYNATCVVCMDGTQAPFTFRIKNKNISTDQVLVGTSDKYMSVCRKHYLELDKSSGF